MSDHVRPVVQILERKARLQEGDLVHMLLDDVRQVEGMSSPETFESPRMSLLPGVIEEDDGTLRKWEEGSKSTKRSKVSTRMHSSGHRSHETRQTGLVKSRRKDTQRYKELPGKDSTDCNAKISEIAKMRSKLADEVGCDEDELGDWLELSKHARKLQQAIHTADVEIQKQSGLIDETGIETQHEKNIEGEFTSHSKSWPTESHASQQVSENNSVSDIDQHKSHTQATGLGVDANVGMGESSMTKARHLEQPKSTRADTLPELSEYDNEECDAEVASMDLEKCEELEKRMIGLTDEEEELRMFEELEARLEQDENQVDKPEKGVSGVPKSHDDNLTRNKGGSDASLRQEESFNLKHVSDASGENWLASQNTDKAKAGANTEKENIVEHVSETVGDSEGSPEHSCNEINRVCQSSGDRQFGDTLKRTVTDTEQRSLSHTKMQSANASAKGKDDNLLQNVVADEQSKAEDGDTHVANLARGVRNEAESPDEVSVDCSTKEVSDSVKDVTDDEGAGDLQMDNSVCRSPDSVETEGPLSCDEHTGTIPSSPRQSPSSAVDAEQGELQPDHNSQSTSDQSSSERHKDESFSVFGEGTMDVTASPISPVGDHGLSTVKHVTAHPCSKDGTDVDDPRAGWMQHDQQSLDEEYEDAEIDRPISTKESRLMLDLIPSSEAGTDVDAPAMVCVEHTDEPSTADEFETPPSGMSPCVTPPRAFSPSAASPGESLPRRMSTPEADDIVKRRSPKGRVSPSKRFSEGANKQNKPANVSQKTDSCVVS